MTLFRIAKHEFANDISGYGAMLFGGRWNPKGLPALYTSSFRSLALLETIVNIGRINTEICNQLSLIEIEIESKAILELSAEKLKKNWFWDYQYTQKTGSEFLIENNFLMLKIPSVIIHQEYNVIINPKHQDFKKIKIKKIQDFPLDSRFVTQ